MHAAAHMHQASRHTRICDPDVRPAERTYAVIAHLTVLASAILIPLVPIIIMHCCRKAILRDDATFFVSDHTREALNFQLSLVVYTVVLTLLLVPTLGLAGLGLLAVTALGIVGSILGAVAASKNEYFRAPMTIRFLS